MFILNHRLIVFLGGEGDFTVNVFNIKSDGDEMTKSNKLKENISKGKKKKKKERRRRRRRIAEWRDDERA